jgi:hypothetical protein
MTVQIKSTNLFERMLLSPAKHYIAYPQWARLGPATLRQDHELFSSSNLVSGSVLHATQLKPASSRANAEATTQRHKSAPWSHLSCSSLASGVPTGRCKAIVSALTFKESVSQHSGTRIPAAGTGRIRTTLHCLLDRLPMSRILVDLGHVNTTTLHPLTLKTTSSRSIVAIHPHPVFGRCDLARLRHLLFVAGIPSLFCTPCPSHMTTGN